MCRQISGNKYDGTNDALSVPVYSSDLDADIHAAVTGGSTDEVRALLDAGVDVDRKYASDYTALMIASSYGYADIASILIDAKADPRLKNGYGNTALKYAKQNKDDDIAEPLRDASER
jgi:ankyrin repeat protein